MLDGAWHVSDGVGHEGREPGGSPITQEIAAQLVKLQQGFT